MTQNPAPKTRLAWALVGAGDISRKRVAPALRDLPESRFVSVSRRRAGLAAEFAAEFGAERAYPTWEEQLADDELDAVYVATPVHLHEPVTLAAAERGLHVLCEKPMALSLAECDRMIDASRSNGVRLGIAYYRCFYPVLSRIKEILASGEIGRPALVRIDAFEYYNPEPSDPRYWFVQKKYAGGGPMFDFGCHRIELLLNLFGEPESVEGRTWNLQLEREVEDTALAVFTFPEGLAAILSVTHTTFEGRDTLEIFGSGGSLHVPVLNRGELRVVSKEGERVESHPPHPNLHYPLIEDFTHSILRGSEPRMGGAVGRRVNEILAEIYSPRMDTRDSG